MRQKGNRLMKRMILNKLLMSMVPIVIFLVFIGILFASVNMNNFRNMQSNALEADTDELAAHYEDLLVMRDKLEANTSVRTFFPQNHDYIDYGILDAMTTLCLPRTYYSHFWLYLNGHPYMYSAANVTAGTEVFNAAGQGYFEFSEVNNAQLRGLMEENDEIAILPVQEITVSLSEKTPYIVILMPVERGSSQLGTLLAFLSAERLSTSVGGSSAGDYGSIFTDRQGNVIYTDFDGEFTAWSIGQGADYFSGRSYHGFVRDAYLCDMTVYRMVSYAYSRHGTDFVYILATVLAVACVVWVLILIYISLKYEYRPIRNISDKCVKYMYGSGANYLGGELNELQVLSKTFDFFKSVSVRPNAESEEVKPLFGSSLLRGRIAADELCRPHEGYAQICILILSVRVNAESEKFFRDYFEDDAELKVSVEYTEFENMFLLAVSYNTNSDFNGFVNRFSEALCERFGKKKVKIAISECAEGARYSSVCFDAKFALRYMETKCLDDTVLLSDIIRENMLDDGKAAIELLGRLDIAVHVGDYRRIDAVLDEIIEYILNPDTSWDNCEILFSYARNSLMSMLRGLLSEHDYIELYDRLNSEIANVNIMALLLGSLRNYLSDCFAESEVKKREKFDVQAVAEYIGKHFREPSFSLNSVASEFGVNASLFSRQFKEKFGMNFKDYIDEMVMNEAKNYLLETDKTIDEIASLLNYSNASNFLRAFKKRYGVSAGQFRKNFREE